MSIFKFLKNNLIKPKSNETNNFNVVPNIHNTDNFDTKDIHTLYINYPTHSSEEIKQMLGRKWLSILKRVYVFYETYKHVIPTNPNVSIPLSTISPVLQEFLGYQVNVSNFIKFMKKIDLLIVDKTRYSNLFHICKTYFFNKKLMLVLKEMFKELGFDENTIKEVYKKTKKQRKKKMKRSLKKKTELKETNLGDCWDMTELERDFCEKNEIPCKCYFSLVNENDNTHTFLTFENEGKLFYFERSWDSFKGIYQIGNLEEVFDVLTNNFKEQEKLLNCPKIKRISFYEYPKPIKYHLDCVSFQNYCIENGKLFYII